MEYVIFKETFCEKIVSCLPVQYSNVKVKMEAKMEVFSGKVYEQAFLMYEDISLCQINLQKLFEMEKEKIENTNLDEYVFSLAENLKDILSEAFEKHGIKPETADKENHLLCTREDNVYDFRCIEIQGILENLEVFRDIARKEQSDLLIVPFNEQLIVIPEKEIQEEDMEIQEFLLEIQKNMMFDMEHYGNHVLLFDMSSEQIQKIAVS